MALVAEDSLATADNHEAKMGQDGANQDQLKMAQTGPKMRQDGQNELKWIQDNPKLPQDDQNGSRNSPQLLNAEAGSLFISVSDSWRSNHIFSATQASTPNIIIMHWFSHPIHQ